MPKFLLLAVAILAGCGEAPREAPREPPLDPFEFMSGINYLNLDGDLIDGIETYSELRRKRVCLNAGAYRLEARAQDGTPVATAGLWRDDGSEDGELVTLAMINAGQQRTVREPFAIDADGDCYWLTIETSIRGVTTQARIYLVNRPPKPTATEAKP